MAGPSQGTSTLQVFAVPTMYVGDEESVTEPMSNGSRDTRGEVEQLAEGLILADSSDAQSVRDLAARFAALSSRAVDEGEPGVAALSAEAAGALESLAAGEATADEVFTRTAAIVTDLQLTAATCAPGLRSFMLGIAVEPEEAAEPWVEPLSLTATSNPLADDPELLADFVARAMEHMEAADAHLVALEANPDNSEELNCLFRCFHTVKGMAGFLSLDAVAALAHESEGLLDESRSSGAPLDPHAIEDLFTSIDRVKSFAVELDGSLGRRFGGEVSGESADVPSEPAGCDAPDDDSAQPTVQRRTGAGTTDASGRIAVRVDADRLDHLLDAIGELVIAESFVSSSLRTDVGSGDLVIRGLERLDRITRSIQELATSLRMVSLRTTFMKMARVVRDTARRSGKDVEFIANGEDTELDKAVVDAIADPLVHMLRNAVDHGIEASLAERTAAGKSPTGRVELRAFHRGGSVYIEVEDDGRGLDLEAIRRTGIERGLITANDTRTARDILNLIFEPGFSTALSVTDVSGRGVGMDVVRGVVESLRGQVEIRTEHGVSTTISMRLPLTLAIIDGIVVRVGQERYIIPTLSVLRSVRPRSEDVTTVAGSGEILRQGEEIIRMIRLSDYFRVPGATADVTQAIVVILEDEGRHVGVMVDELLDQQSVVIKSLSGPTRESQGLAGAAVMPDGKAGLILDVTGLVRLADSESVQQVAQYESGRE